jgi:exosome complex component RRP45
VIGGALDTEALVLQAGKWVWRIRVSLTVLDDGGNLLDACVLAALASLRHYRKPQVQFLPAEMSGTPTSAGKTSAQKSADSDDDDNNSAGLPVLVPSTVKEATPLPLHHTPLSISFGLIPGEETNGGGGISNTGSSLPSSSSTIVALIDPSDREELVQSGSLTIAMNIHSEVCLLDYGGGCELAPSKLRECWITAETAIKGLCELLEMTIAEADERAQNDQLRRLQLQRKQLEGSGHADDFVALSLPPLPSSDRKNTPYLHEMEDIDDLQVAESSAPDSTELNMIDQAQTEAEEAYRRQALDYSINHLPSAVRESNEDGKSGDTSLASAHAHAGSLLAAMLQSVCHNSSAPAANEVHSSGERKHRSNSVSATTESKSTLKRSPEEPSGKEYTMDLDGCIGDDVVDDEEEPTTSMLESEFRAGSTVPAPSDDKATSAAQNNVRGFVDDDVEIDDFSMAIKSKKSKNKKKISKKSR